MQICSRVLKKVEKYSFASQPAAKKKKFFLLSVIELLHPSLNNFFDNLNGYTVRVSPS